MLDLGVTPYIFSLGEGEMSLLHPSAKKALDFNLLTKITNKSKKQSLKYICRLFLMHPRNTIFALFKAFRSRYRWIYFQAAYYAFMLLNMKVQFIHAHFADANLRWAKVLSDWTGIPFGVTTHRYDILDDPIPVNEASQLYAKANLIISISKYNKCLMTQKYNLSPDKIKIIHCGIDTTRFKPHQSLVKFNDRKLKFINIGRLVPQKGQDIVLRALAEVKERGVQFEMQIIGCGHLKNDLSDLAKSMGIDDCVHFAGAQNQEVVIEMLNKTDIFILSSRSEGLPIVCMEAMSMEVFLIATRIFGIPELVSDRENGLLVEPEDVQGLADAICWADKNRGALKTMTINARKKVEKHFNRNSCISMLYREMNIAVNAHLKKSKFLMC